MDFLKENLLEWSKKVAMKGGRHTLKYFKSSLNIEYKEDHSPVTRADKETESIMREMIMEKFPDHGILGEEHGRINSESDIQWIIDPIDGTLSFIHGVPLYTTLIGILVKGKPVAGVIYAPVLDEMCDAAIGLGTRFNDTECHVRECRSLAKATLLTTDINDVFDNGYEKPYRKLMQSVNIHRSWGDAYGHMLVATGRADIMFDPLLNIWDAAPLLPVIQEAGGSFTDVKGRATIESGNGYSCNKFLFPQIQTILNS
ncbi:MAG TPA: inositol monophosphatase family protein [Balneolales bacterium]|nr:inositol monophosphatase family protein [Balneolales bacterium]